MALETLDDNDSSNGWPSYVPSNLALGNPGSPVNTAGGIPMPPVQGLNPGAPAPAPGMALPTGGAPPPAADLSSFSAFRAAPDNKLDYTQKMQQAYTQYDELLKKQSEQSNRMPWFQMAAGFLDPGKTGSFGESLGKASGAIGQYKLEQQKNAIPLAKARLELMQAGYGLERDKAAKELATKLIGGKSVSEALDKNNPVVPISENTKKPYDPGATKTTLVGSGVSQEDLKNAPRLTVEDAAAFGVAYGDTQMAKILMDLAKESKRTVRLAQNGVAFMEDPKHPNGGYYISDQPIPGQEQKPFTTQWGTFAMRPSDSDRFSAMNEKDQVAYLTKNYGKNSDGSPKSSEDIAVTATGRKEASTKAAIQDARIEDDLFNFRIGAQAVMPVYKRMQRLYETVPGLQDAMRANFKNGKPTDLLASVLSGDHSAGTMSAIQGSLRRFGKPDEIINAFNEISTLRGRAETAMAASIPGFMSRVSDYRTKFLTSLHPDANEDLPGAFSNKLNALIGNAQYDIDRHDLYTQLKRDNPNLRASQFITEPKARELYDKHVENAAQASPTSVLNIEKPAPVSKIYPPAPTVSSPPVPVPAATLQPTTMMQQLLAAKEAKKRKNTQ